MAQGNVGLRFNIDTSQAKTQVADLSRTIADLNAQIKQATEEEDWKAVAMLTQSLNDTTSARSGIMKQAQQFQAQNNAQNGGGIFQGQSAWMLQQALTQITHGIIKSMDAALSAAKQRASGDYAGAAVTERRAQGEITGQAIGAGIGALGFLVPGAGALLGPLLMGLGGQIGQFIGGIDAKKLEERLAFSQQYKSALPSMDILNQNFGGAINRNSAGQNNSQAMQMYSHARAAAAGTGLSTQAFIDAMKVTGSHGIRNETQALNMTQNQALWSRFTGTDLSTIQSYAGKAYRFGGDTGAVSTAYGGLMSQNMAKGQFAEFLTSMERILEEGIAKGFTRSSEEIAGNMTMLYKLSGGSKLWQGEQGAQRMSQMNSAIANASNLQTVSDVLSFGVARDVFKAIDERNPGDFELGKDVQVGPGKEDTIKYTGTYFDTLQLLGRGLSPALLKGQFEAIDRIEGKDNTAGQIERIKTMFGLNDRGAVEVWGMKRAAMDEEGNYNFDAGDYYNKIKEYRETPGFASDSQLLQDQLNIMNQTLVAIGSKHFPEELRLLGQAQSDVAAILAELTGKKRTEPLTAKPDSGGLLGLFPTSWLQKIHMDKAGPDRSRLINESDKTYQNYLTAVDGEGKYSRDPNAKEAGALFGELMTELGSPETATRQGVEAMRRLDEMLRYSTSINHGDKKETVSNDELAEIKRLLGAVYEAIGKGIPLSITASTE